MKKGRIINIQLNKAIASLGHLDWIIISDAGLPVEREEQRIDLAIEAGKPEIAEILDLVTSDLVYERCIVAKEQKDYNPIHFANVERIIDRCKVETIPHASLLEYKKKAKYIIRTGGFEPWGNIVLCCGIDAPVWFQKKGVITPSYYAERANYKEKEKT